MKKFSAFLVVLVFVLASCNKSGSAQPADKDASYAFGMAIGTSLQATSVSIDYNEFVKGMRDVLEGSGGKMSMDQAEDLINRAINQAMLKASEENIKRETEFFQENRQRHGVFETASGLQYEIIRDAGGVKPASTDLVTVHYEGSLLNGIIFDSSYSRGEPIQFFLDQVIPGWSEGVQLMSPGAKFKFYIPSVLGYGPQGAGAMIGPNETLIFEVELLEILPPDATMDY